MRRREFVAATAGLFATSIPALVRAQEPPPCMPPTLTTDEGITATNYCNSTGGLSYISSMAPFEVRPLSGAFAPTNGKVALTAVTPAEWNPGNTSQGINDNVLRPWSGGAKQISSTIRKLYVHGGGHADSANNGMYVYDFSGTNAPTGWSLPEISNVADVREDSKYADGRPQSVHTYSGQCEVGGYIWRAGGSQYHTGNFINTLWRYAPNAPLGSRWTQMPSFSTAGGGCLIGIQPNSSFPYGKILWVNHFSTPFDYQFFTPNATSGTWSSKKSATLRSPQDLNAAYKPLTDTTGIILMAGNPASGVLSCHSATVDWSAETLKGETDRTSTISISGHGPLMFYDTSRDSFWMMQGDADYSKLYEFNAMTFAQKSGSPHVLSGIAAAESGTSGDYGRFLFMTDVRALCIVTSRFNPPYVVKLP